MKEKLIKKFWNKKANNKNIYRKIVHSSRGHEQTKKIHTFYYFLNSKQIWYGYKNVVSNFGHSKVYILFSLDTMLLIFIWSVSNIFRFANKNRESKSMQQLITLKNVVIKLHREIFTVLDEIQYWFKQPSLSSQLQY